jgi:hypothetical protein
MQTQKDIKKSTESLLDKKADTKEGSRQMEITDISWSFRPAISYKTDSQKGHNVPTLDKIAKTVIKNKDASDKDTTDSDLESQETVDQMDTDEQLIRLYNDLLRYSFTEEYLLDCTPSEAYHREVNLRPYIFIKLESNFGEEIYASIGDPFRSNNIKNILNAAETDQNVNLMYESEIPTLVINDQKYKLSHTQVVGEKKSLEVKIMDAISTSNNINDLIMSNYDGWYQIDVKSVNTEDTKSVIQTTNDNLNWVFDEPIVWDEEQEDIVKILESFANGDKDQLTDIYIRPINATMDNSRIDTKTHRDTNWEIALEEPNTQPKKDISGYDILMVIYLVLIFTLLLIGFAVIVSFLTTAFLL